MPQVAVQRAALRDLQDLVTSGSGWQIFSQTLPDLFRRALDELEQTGGYRFEEIEEIVEIVEKISNWQRPEDVEGERGEKREGQVVVGVSVSMNSLRRRGWGKDIRTRGSRLGQS